MGPWAFLSEEPPIFASLGAITYELAALWAHACSPYFSHVIMNNHEWKEQQYLESLLEV